MISFIVLSISLAPARATPWPLLFLKYDHFYTFIIHFMSEFIFRAVLLLPYK